MAIATTVLRLGIEISPYLAHIGRMSAALRVPQHGGDMMVALLAIRSHLLLGSVFSASTSAKAKKPGTMKVVARLLAGNSDLIPRPSLNSIHHAKAMRCGVPMSDIIDDGAAITTGEGRRMARVAAQSPQRRPKQILPPLYHANEPRALCPEIAVGDAAAGDTVECALAIDPGDVAAGADIHDLRHFRFARR
ncbi:MULTISPECIES: hypothetical protein [unclassified Shinella]|uniref:hypothetical protein n=1 Tax=unclassified Shinella TaxID=2643062 RepID=UPI00234EC33D|nr:MULTISPECIES: hypothetical protein [unclassified Shinella]MCO5140474.1 hypothetical protein [Shinella sp.]MDC7254803.1 hypothetical protein [Shinella sp. YE25]